MAKMTIRVPHALLQDAAVARAKEILGDVQREHGDMVSNVSEKWDGNTCSFSLSVMGNDIEGTIVVGDSDLNLSAKVPFMATFFKGRIEQEIRKVAEDRLL